MYIYEELKPVIFTEKGQTEFLKVRAHVHHLLQEAGAFRMDKAWEPLSCFDCWSAMAYVDRLKELGEINEITRSSRHGLDRVFEAGGLQGHH